MQMPTLQRILFARAQAVERAPRRARDRLRTLPRHCDYNAKRLDRSTVRLRGARMPLETEFETFDWHRAASASTLAIAFHCYAHTTLAPRDRRADKRLHPLRRNMAQWRSLAPTLPLSMFHCFIIVAFLY